MQYKWRLVEPLEAAFVLPISGRMRMAAAARMHSHHRREEEHHNEKMRRIEVP
jgi:hypothetical protein